MSQSEVAQLRISIEQEIQAMRQGLSGLAVGTSKHQFIEAKMRTLGEYQDQLAEHVGTEEANQLCCLAYIQGMEEVKG